MSLETTCRFMTNLFLCLVLFFVSMQSYALEGGQGRTIPGLWIGIRSGTIPSTPGFHYGMGVLYYDRQIRTATLGGEVVNHVRAKSISETTTITYIPKNQHPGRTYGFAVAFPSFSLFKINAEVEIPPPPVVETRARLGLTDTLFIPYQVMWKSGSTSKAFRFLIYAPTGYYHLGDISSTGTNKWTFMPIFGTTIERPDSDWIYSAITGVDFFLKNPETDYQNGVVFHIDLLAAKKMKHGWEIGGIFGWVQQLNDDSGVIADSLGGLMGHAMGAGPIAQYTFKSGDRDITSALRIIKEFNVRHRTHGWFSFWTVASKF